MELIDRVCEHVDLVEKDYFSLVFMDGENARNWSVISLLLKM